MPMFFTVTFTVVGDDDVAVDAVEAAAAAGNFQYAIVEHGRRQAADLAVSVPIVVFQSLQPGTLTAREKTARTYVLEMLKRYDIDDEVKNLIVDSANGSRSFLQIAGREVDWNSAYPGVPSCTIWAALQRHALDWLRLHDPKHPLISALADDVMKQEAGR